MAPVGGVDYPRSQAAVAEPITSRQLLIEPGGKRRRFSAPEGPRRNPPAWPYRPPSDPGAAPT
jgi:hypothetical protein